jgi:hypothetical protein
MSKKKIIDLFKIAGTVVSATLFKKCGTFIGLAVIEFIHPVEAVQAICVLFC